MVDLGRSFRIPCTVTVKRQVLLSGLEAVTQGTTGAKGIYFRWRRHGEGMTREVEVPRHVHYSRVVLPNRPSGPFRK